MHDQFEKISSFQFVSAPYYVTCTVDAVPSISWFASTNEGTLGVGAVCIIVAVM